MAFLLFLQMNCRQSDGHLSNAGETTQTLPETHLHYDGFDGNGVNLQCIFKVLSGWKCFCQLRFALFPLTVHYSGSSFGA
jgi:hypothetical protein